MNIELFPEQEHGVRILATALSTTTNAVIGALITKGLKEALTDDVIQKAADKDRRRVEMFRDPK